MKPAELNFHRKTAIACFNEAWDYLDKKRRSPEDDLKMLQLAHASRYHWGLVGNPSNLATGDWQLSRVYATLNEPALATRYAQSSLELCKKYRLTDMEHTAYEALARAYAVSGQPSTAQEHLLKARKLLSALNLDSEDRKIYLDQILDTERLIKARSK